MMLPTIRYLVVTGFKKAPWITWGLATSIGIFIAGLYFGLLVGIKADYPGTPANKLKEENQKFKNLIWGYERLSGLYLYQAQDVGVFLNSDALYNHPEEVTAAVRSIDQQRGLINVQIGRVLELRRAAGMPEVSYDHSPITKN